jgi:hypothetical protein
MPLKLCKQKTRLKKQGDAEGNPKTGFVYFLIIV